METILCGQLGRDCELPDATFASEDGHESLAHNMVLTFTKRSHHISRLQILFFKVSYIYLIIPPYITPILEFFNCDNCKCNQWYFNVFGKVCDINSNSKQKLNLSKVHPFQNALIDGVGGGLNPIP